MLVDTGPEDGETQRYPAEIGGPEGGDIECEIRRFIRVDAGRTRRTGVKVSGNDRRIPGARAGQSLVSSFRAAELMQ